ncbi:MAG: response regulator [Ruminococcaceae bacterium]|nr:response regulator [Oscillospiraceae bacterium]
MLRMIIADDEKVIRETINSLIDWHSLGIEVIGLCKNGIEAYDMILDEYPDIVMTDINMPGLSGLALIRRIHQTSQGTQFVILSGYGDFAFTKEAMRLGIQHYLLKPCNEQEIIDVMQDVKQKCMQKRMRDDTREQNVVILKQLQESVFYNISLECFTDCPDFAGLAQKYDRFISFTNVGYELCRIKNANESVRGACIAAFEANHKLRAPNIPYYCMQADLELLIFCEAYDYDYSALDDDVSAACTKRDDYTRVSFACLNELIPQLHKIVHTHSHIELGGQRRQPDFNRSAPIAIPSENDDPIDKVISIVHQNISDENLSLKLIAETQLYMNVDYVSRKFLKKTGQKFSAFLANARVERAKQIFAAGSTCVNCVAEEVGCGNNPQYFSQLFKRVTGITPTEYLKTI